MGSAGRWRGHSGAALGSDKPYKVPHDRLTALYRLTAISLYEAMFFNSFA